MDGARSGCAVHCRLFRYVVKVRFGEARPGSRPPKRSERSAQLNQRVRHSGAQAALAFFVDFLTPRTGAQLVSHTYAAPPLPPQHFSVR